MHLIAACLLAQASPAPMPTELALAPHDDPSGNAPSLLAEEGASARLWTIDLLVGTRAYDETDWEPVESQISFGALVTRRIGQDGWAVEVGASTSSDDARLTDGVDVLELEAEFMEASLAARYFLEVPDSKAEAYFSLGLAWQESTIKARILGGGPSMDESESSIGALLGVGVGWRATDLLRLGLDLRGVIGSEAEFEGIDISTDYAQFGVFVGAAF
jgi:hypothetical protein